MEAKVIKAEAAKPSAENLFIKWQAAKPDAREAIEDYVAKTLPPKEIKAFFQKTAAAEVACLEETSNIEPPPISPEETGQQEKTAGVRAANTLLNASPTVVAFPRKDGDPLTAAEASEQIAARKRAREDTREAQREQRTAEDPEPAAKAEATSEQETLLAKMNQQHALIKNIGGHTRIARWDLDEEGERRIAYQTKESFSLQYANQYVKIKQLDKDNTLSDGKMQAGAWWLNHRDRREYESVVFMPGKGRMVNGNLNLWTGWKTQPKAGDWGLIRQHIFEVYANGDVAKAEYILRWLAWLLQNPGTRAEVALCLIGEKGAGKGTLGDILRRIFGRHLFQSGSADQIFGKFNQHLMETSVLIADEIKYENLKRLIGQIQTMITEPKLVVEPKGLGIIQIPNPLHMLMFAEPGHAIPAGRNERRYAVFGVSDRRVRDFKYFRALRAEIAGDGPAAMFYDLLAMDLGDWHPREIPAELLRDETLRKQQSFTFPVEEQWYVSLLHEGRLPGSLANYPNTAWTTPLLEDARRRVPGLKYKSDRALIMFLQDKVRIGIACEPKRSAACNGWAFPPLAECRRAWEAKYGPQDWETESPEWKHWDWEGN